MDTEFQKKVLQGKLFSRKEVSVLHVTIIYPYLVQIINQMLRPATCIWSPLFETAFVDGIVYEHQTLKF